MDSLLPRIEKLAHITFSKSVTDESFPGSLSELVNLVKDLKLTDLDVVPSKSLSEDNSDATYSFIKQTDVFTMGMFMLRDGCKIPLHDHPNMHCILKTVDGTVKVTSYTLKAGHRKEARIPENSIEIFQEECLIPVEKCMDAHVSTNDMPVVVTPTEGNFHEIRAVGGAAVLFDILSPFYDEDKRICHFYNTVGSKGSDEQEQTWLYELAKSNFSCQVASYTGPRTTL